MISVLRRDSPGDVLGRCFIRNLVPRKKMPGGFFPPSCFVQSWGALRQEVFLSFPPQTTINERVPPFDCGWSVPWAWLRLVGTGGRVAGVIAVLHEGMRRKCRSAGGIAFLCHRAGRYWRRASAGPLKCRRGVTLTTTKVATPKFRGRPSCSAL